MEIDEIQLRDWQQFGNVTIAFDPKLTVITGANGSGKTTLLNIYGRHLDMDFASIALPVNDKKSGVSKWIAGVLGRRDNPLYDNREVIGYVKYKLEDGAPHGESQIMSPVAQQADYRIEFSSLPQLNGLYIKSHRPEFRYEQLQSIPTRLDQITKKSAYEKVFNWYKIRFQNSYSEHNWNYHIKEVLVAWNTFGFGNESMEPNPEYLRNFRGFEKILKAILPENLGFKRLKIAQFEIIFECEGSNSFVMDSASGGITALIDIAWQIYMYQEEKEKRYTVLIDEVENHLHPSMQRELLPKLTKAFPNVQFIVTTHSPLVVNSVKNSTVYVLQRSPEDKKIYAKKLNLSDEIKTANEILDEVLGVSFAMPMWVQDEFNEITSILNTNPSSEELLKVTHKLENLGMDKLIPDAVNKAIKQDDLGDKA